MPCKAKVRYLQSGLGALLCQQEILRLQVTVDQAVRPQEVHTIPKLAHEVLGGRFTQKGFLPD
jgi:hypothetical protein